MRVLLIDVNCKGSSTGSIVYDLYTCINNNGDEAAICYGRGLIVKGRNIFKFGLDWETYIHAFLTRLTGFTGCFSFFSTRRLLKYIRLFDPDVVHIHELHAYFVNIKPLIHYLKRKHIKTIMTLHCEFSYTGKCGHSVECEQWKIECKKCPHLHDYISTLFFDHTKYMFRQKKKLFEDFNDLTIVTPSQWLANRAKKSFFKKHEIVVIHNGIDTDVFYPRNTTALRDEYHVHDNEKIVLALAPNLMSREKGGIYVLQLAKKLKNLSIRFFLVGVDRNIEVNEDNIVIIGRIYDKNLLAQFYSLADVFVICSERENYPTTCIEAQCCGTPVCGFDTGGSKETAIDFAARFVPYGDSTLLSASIITVLNNSANNRSAISQLACNKFNSISMNNKYIKLYRAKVEKEDI